MPARPSSASPGGWRRLLLIPASLACVTRPRPSAGCCCALAPYPLLFVGVQCPLDEVIRREAARGDRTLGRARAHFRTVHAHAGDDVEVDTSVADPDECARVVADAIAAHHGLSRLLALG